MPLYINGRKAPDYDKQVKELRNKVDGAGTSPITTGEGRMAETASAMVTGCFRTAPRGGGRKLDTPEA